MKNIWDNLLSWLQALTAPPLEWLTRQLNTLFDPLDAWLASLSTETGRWCAVALFVIAMVWAVTRSREFIFRGAPDQAAWRDLRIWSVVALTPYILIYIFLF